MGKTHVFAMDRLGNSGNDAADLLCASFVLWKTFRKEYYGILRSRTFGAVVAGWAVHGGDYVFQRYA